MVPSRLIGLPLPSPLMGELPEPTFADVLDAAKQIRPFLAPTPLRRYPSLDRLAGASVFVKHENHNPTGAFKVRGGVNLVSRLSEDERSRGVIAASTGNHGQSVAFAARQFGVSAIICAPAVANPVKVESIRDIGVQSEQAPSAYLSWKSGELQDAPNRTRAEGLSTAAPFELPQRILRRHVDDFVLVSDDEIDAATSVMIEKTRTLVEAAGAAALAGAIKLRDQVRGKKIALICSGGNISPDQLR